MGINVTFVVEEVGLSFTFGLFHKDFFCVKCLFLQLNIKKILFLELFNNFNYFNVVHIFSVFKEL